jgi:hypothetical protein
MLERVLDEGTEEWKHEYTYRIGGPSGRNTEY